MKVVILAGGLGTRLSEYTKKIPKPMVPIGGKPILMHIIDSYRKFGLNDFYIALGYKGDIIKNFFLDLAGTSSKKVKELILQDTINIFLPNLKINITLVDTGEETMTGGRLKKLKKILGPETFLMTYGDGLSDINIHSLIASHLEKNKLVTISAVHPIARFGELKINSNGDVISFKEKPQLQQGWINGGFFVIEPSFLEFIKDDSTVLEKEPLEQAADSNELSAFQHEGFWYCMDTQRDKEYLDQLLHDGFSPWL
tara:strand:- start:1847 stop:2611 length:765 start_codon:yes stop_codon:yes gene_type:complete